MEKELKTTETPVERESEKTRLTGDLRNRIESDLAAYKAGGGSTKFFTNHFMNLITEEKIKVLEKLLDNRWCTANMKVIIKDLIKQLEGEK